MPVSLDARPGRRALAILGLAACLSGGVPDARAEPAPEVASESVTLAAADGLAIGATYTRAANPRAIVLLFHQAGSGRGEYAAIAPVLARAGFSALAIDQRSGGNLFGRNETAARAGRAGFLDAKPDLAAALGWAGAEAERLGRGKSPPAKPLPVVLWGSSYSAALVFLVAAENPGKVAGLLAFSPGEYLGGATTVRAAAARVTVPVFVTSASDPGEIAAARTILAAVPGCGAPTCKVQAVPKAGEHGSSTLIPARNPAGAADNWPPVLAFLDGLAR